MLQFIVVPKFVRLFLNRKMIVFFKTQTSKIIAVQYSESYKNEDIPKLNWLLAAEKLEEESISGFFVGPRAEMVSPWSTNAVEITQNMGISSVIRMEEFKIENSGKAVYDKMLEVLYTQLNQELFTINIQPEPIKYIDDIAAYSQQEGLALSDEEVTYLDNVSKKKQ